MIRVGKAKEGKKCDDEITRRVELFVRSACLRAKNTGNVSANMRKKKILRECEAWVGSFGWWVVGWIDRFDATLGSWCLCQMAFSHFLFSPSHPPNIHLKPHQGLDYSLLWVTATVLEWFPILKHYKPKMHLFWGNLKNSQAQLYSTIIPLPSWKFCLFCFSSTSIKQRILPVLCVEITSRWIDNKWH